MMPAAGSARTAAPSASPDPVPPAVTAQVRADVARFFVDLRRTIGANAVQAAQQLNASPQVIAALESGDVAALPPWPQTQRLVMGYAAWAGIDGRPVLNALALLIKDAAQRRETERQAAQVRPGISASSERLRQIQMALSEGARWIPKEALSQARERPVRTFYALSMPLALLFLTLNPQWRTAVAGALRPFSGVTVHIADYWAVTFAPRREGLRWIEISDPRRRRADRLSTRE